MNKLTAALNRERKKALWGNKGGKEREGGRQRGERERQRERGGGKEGGTVRREIRYWTISHVRLSASLQNLIQINRTTYTIVHHLFQCGFTYAIGDSLPPGCTRREYPGVVRVRCAVEQLQTLRPMSHLPGVQENRIRHTVCIKTRTTSVNNKQWIIIQYTADVSIPFLYQIRVCTCTIQ